MLWWTLIQLKSKDIPTRVQAVQVLGSSGNWRVVKPLIAALKDEDSGVREAAVWGLGKIKDVEAVEPLIAALKDEDSGVRKAAVRGLEEQEWQPASESQKAWLAIVREDWKLVIQLGKAAVEPLIFVLKKKNGSALVRKEAAVWALGIIKDVEAVEPLIAALSDSDNHDTRGMDWWSSQWVIEKIKEQEVHSLERFSVPAVAVFALKSILDNVADKVSTEMLHTIIKLPSITEILHIDAHNTCSSWSKIYTKENEIDCSHLRQLARQELIRRGIKA